MVFTEYNNIEIRGVATVLPEEKVAVEAFTGVFDKDTIKKFMDMTGVRSFYRSNPAQTASDLGFIAAKRLLHFQNIDLSDIGYCIFVTQKPDYRLPGSSFIIHKRLNLPEDCTCFDINLACSGFIFGLNTLCAMLQGSSKKYGLLLTGDTSHRTMSPEDRTLIMLFGDNGTATLVERIDNSTTKTRFAMRSKGEKFKSIITPAGAYRNRFLPVERTIWSDGIKRSDYDTHMKGMDVFGFSITDVPALINDFLNKNGQSSEDYDYFAIHQANMYIIKQISRKVKIPMEKIPVSIDRFGNNSSSSVPLVLSDHFGGEDSNKYHFLMSGFGGGLSYGCCDAVIDTAGIMAIYHSDETFSV